MKDLIERASKIKIIFFDIDDTLRDLKTGYIPENLPFIFETLRQKGIKTGIATGRNYYNVLPEIRNLNPDFFVTINGALVQNQAQEIIYKNPLAKETVDEIVSWLKSEGAEYLFVGNENLKASKWKGLTERVIPDDYGALEVNPDYYKAHDVFQLLTISEHDQELRLPQRLAQQVRMVRWHPNSSDIVPVLGSKANGCMKVLEYLGLSPENMMNFGDELNDKELFDLAGLSVAMKISHPVILEKADYVTDTVQNDGVLKALRALQLID
ncbi:Cof-type HAD-IIB family hydrolase [Lactococcus garvieae]|uniref:Cof-type HAD-IIB family hydrolase n=1 Tax=Lactococcus garvieae TaxID=1363 RepID=UPI00254CC06F|nr:Cof-type HAD-IIB family hydrolase [Lactococcus garvieae]